MEKRSPESVAIMRTNEVRWGDTKQDSVFIAAPGSVSTARQNIAAVPDDVPRVWVYTLSLHWLNRDEVDAIDPAAELFGVFALRQGVGSAFIERKIALGLTAAGASDPTAGDFALIDGELPAATLWVDGWLEIQSTVGDFTARAELSVLICPINRQRDDE